MKGKRILNALGNVDDSYIEEAAPGKSRKARYGWVKWVSAAACLCIVLMGVLVFRGEEQSAAVSNGSGITVSEEGVYIPPTKVILSKSDDAVHDMIGFFIYQGRCYVQYTWVYEEADFVGEYLGTAAGLIDEWTPAEGYVELAGSVSGDFYSVKGFDPEFMLCMVRDDAVELYINDNDLTLKTGADLFENRLHLSENYTNVTYETRESWFYSKDEVSTINEENVEIIEDFITAIDEAPFMRTEDIPLSEGQNNIYDDLEIYHVYFETESGIPIDLRLYEGGYVRFEGIIGACVKADEEHFEEFVNILSE